MRVTSPQLGNILIAFSVMSCPVNNVFSQIISVNNLSTCGVSRVLRTEWNLAGNDDCWEDFVVHSCKDAIVFLRAISVT